MQKWLVACLSVLGVGLGACDRSLTPPDPHPEESRPEYQIALNRYVLYPGTESSDLFLMRADGSDAVNLTNTPYTDETSPTWSPDGKKLAFIRLSPPSLPLTVDLWVMNADGTEQRQLTRHAPSSFASTAVWSPRGNKIAYVLDGDLVLINADGSETKTLVTGLRGIGSPTWSPDETRIAFGAGSDMDRKIYTVRVDGADLTQITSPLEQEDYPAWSPDGRRIAFVRWPSLFGSSTIWSMRPDGSDRVQMLEPIEGRHQVLPSWSPDGRWISYMLFRNRFTPSEAIIVRSDGRGRERLSAGLVIAGPVAWRP